MSPEPRLVGVPELLEDLLLPELAHEDDGLHPPGGEGLEDRLESSVMAEHHCARRGRRGPPASSKAKRDHAPPLAAASAAAWPGMTPAPAITREAALHGRSFGQATSPRPSRIIRSISSATASDRRSSVSRQLHLSGRLGDGGGRDTGGGSRA